MQTATFCAGILNNLDYNSGDCQGLVLAPTRELAQQIEKVMRSLGDFLQVSSFVLHLPQHMPANPMLHGLGHDKRQQAAAKAASPA